MADAPAPAHDPVEPETLALRRLQTAMDEAEAELARRLGMGPSDLAAMGHLTFADVPLTAGGLSARIGLTPGAVTELVDRLERAGHVDRRRDEVDRRRVRLVPTGSALAEVSQHLRPLTAAVDAITRDFTVEERAVVRRFLGRVTEAYARFAPDERAARGAADAASASTAAENRA